MYSLGLNFTITFSINNDLEKLTFLRNANKCSFKRKTASEVLVWISWSMQILELFNSFLPEPV